MRDHCYWPLVSDLSNLLSHRPVALQFLSDDSLLEMWFSFLSMFQGRLIVMILFPHFIRRSMYVVIFKKNSEELGSVVYLIICNFILCIWAYELRQFNLISIFKSQG